MDLQAKLHVINEDYIKKGAKKITGRDAKDAAKITDRIAAVARRGRILGRAYEDITLLGNMIKDYVKGKYTDVPWWVISAAAFALLYVANPLDLIPDHIPILGQVDDGFVIAITMGLLEKQLQAYKKSCK